MKTIITGFAPNMTREELRIACDFLFFPWRWRRWKGGVAVGQIEAWLTNFFGVRHAVAFDSGRSALSLALKALDIGPGSDVLVQAYTCVVVVNAIHSAGANPIFVDMKDNFFMDSDDAMRKMTPQTKAIIIQHTFGIPAPVDEFMAFARDQRINVIEDCAHTLGGRYKGKLLGTFGDIGMFSFGSDKVVSCVRGGAATTSDPIIGKRLRELQTALPATSSFRVFQHLMQYPIFFIGKASYHLGIGKAILWLAKHARLIAPIITAEEKRGVDTHEYPGLLPNALATILIRQLEELQENLLHRKKIVAMYMASIRNPFVTLPRETRGETDYAYLRYPLISNHPKRLRAYAKRRGIILGDWYDAVVAPCVNGCPHVGYADGSCPHAELASRGSVNLPTDISIRERDAKRIIDCINGYRE